MIYLDIWSRYIKSQTLPCLCVLETLEKGTASRLDPPPCLAEKRVKYLTWWACAPERRREFQTWMLATRKSHEDDASQRRYCAGCWSENQERDVHTPSCEALPPRRGSMRFPSWGGAVLWTFRRLIDYKQLAKYVRSHGHSTVLSAINN